MTTTGKTKEYYFKQAIIAYYLEQDPFLSRDDLEEQIDVYEVGMSLPALPRKGEKGNMTVYFGVNN